MFNLLEVILVAAIIYLIVKIRNKNAEEVNDIHRASLLEHQETEMAEWAKKWYPRYGKIYFFLCYN